MSNYLFFGVLLKLIMSKALGYGLITLGLSIGYDI